MAEAGWFVAAVRSGSERQAGEHLLWDGFELEIYFPLRANLEKRHADRPPDVMLRAAFPGYLFVRGRLEDACNALERAKERGSVCYDLVHGAGGLIAMGEDLVEEIREMEAEWRKSPVRLKGRLTIGQTVKVGSGPFMGSLGVVLEVRKQSVEVALRRDGKLGYRVNVPSRIVEGVAEGALLSG